MKRKLFFIALIAMVVAASAGFALAEGEKLQTSDGILMEKTDYPVNDMWKRNDECYAMGNGCWLCWECWGPFCGSSFKVC